MLKITGTMMLVLMLTTLSASAAWLTPTKSDESSAEATYLEADTTYNGNGLRYVNYHNNNMTFDTQDPLEKGMMWLSAEEDDAPRIAFGFDTLVTLNEIVAWNFNDVSKLSYGIQEFRVLYTTDAVLSVDTGNWTAAGTGMMAAGTGSNFYYPNTTIDIATQLPGLDGVELTGVMLEVLETYGTGQAGLSEIHFEGEVVPEPATMGLLAVGGIAMLRSRRRRNKK